MPYEGAPQQNCTCFRQLPALPPSGVANQVPKAYSRRKLTPVVESKILEVCQTKQYQLFIAKAAVDHMHVLLGMRPTQAVSDVVRDLKTNSSAAAFATFSRLSEIIKTDVLWAEGYRAESVSLGALERVRRYIVSQAEHHRAKFRFRARQDAKYVDYGEATSKAKGPPSP
jgi:REP element-mobilizing transposase RayT